MPEETFLQHWIFSRFILPFLLVFFIVFAILEKTKLFGEDKKQLNALVSFVVGLIFVSVVYPTLVVENLILFLTVALVVVFIILLLWGFVFGGIKEGFETEGWMKVILGGLIGIAVIIAVIWATGWYENITGFFAGKTWAGALWTNLLFIVVIAVALAVIIGKKKAS
jgi:hypothetical protein